MEKIFRCEDCFKQLANRHNLSRHRKTCKRRDIIQQFDSNSNINKLQHGNINVEREHASQKKSFKSVPRSLTEYENGKRENVDDNRIFNSPDFHQRNSTPVVRNQGACSTFPDIKKPAKNPKLSAMIDAILNDGESSEASIISDKIYGMKDTIPTKSIAPEKMDYSKMIGPSADEESRKYPIIPCTAKRKQKTEPKKLDYLKMSDPSSDEASQEESTPPRKRFKAKEGGYSSAPTRKRFKAKEEGYSSESDVGRPLSPPAEGTFDDINDDELPLPPKVQFLPENKEELCARAIRLFREFGRGKYKNRNELVFILDELKRRDEIEEEAYIKLNDYLSSKHGLGKEEEEEEDSSEEEEETVEDKIISTVRYLVEHDVREIQQLLDLFEQKASTYYEEELGKLQTLVETWIEDEIQGKTPELGEIKILLTQLEQSKIPRSMLIRFENLLDDIRENQIRVSNAVQPMVLINKESNNREDLLHHINDMIRQKVINEEQAKELLKAGEIDLDKFIDQLKQMKVGRGLKVLPRLTNGLLDKRKELLVSLKKEKNSKQLKCNLMAVLDELLQRRAISKQEHKSMIEQHELHQ